MTQHPRPPLFGKIPIDVEAMQRREQMDSARYAMNYPIRIHRDVLNLDDDRMPIGFKTMGTDSYPPPLCPEKMAKFDAEMMGTNPHLPDGHAERVEAVGLGDDGVPRHVYRDGEGQFALGEPIDAGKTAGISRDQIRMISDRLHEGQGTGWRFFDPANFQHTSRGEPARVVSIVGPGVEG